MLEEEGSKVVNVDVEKLHFDLINPRFPALSDQRDALHAFCDDAHAKKTVALAADIAERGLNPSELLIVIRAPRRGHYEVLEGNRRLAALKLLSLPARLADTSLSSAYKARLRNAAQLVDPLVLNKVPCRLLSSREEANFWIALKHTGQNDGVGVVEWNGEEAARFRGEDPALQILDYVKTHALLSQAAQRGLKKFHVTNLDRLLGDPDVRKALGLVIEQGTVSFLYPADQVLGGLTKVVEDIAKKDLRVTAIKLKQDRANYIESIHSHLPSGTPLDTPIDLSGTPRPVSTPIPAINRPDTRHQGKNRPTVRERKTIIAKSCVIPVPLAKANEIFIELTKLDADSFPVAASALLRAFIDITTLEYFEKFSLTATENGRGQVDLKPRISSVLEDFKTRYGNRELCSAVRNTLLQPTGVIRVDSLHINLHGRYDHPIPDHMRTGWETIEPWMRGLWAAIEALASGS